MNTLRVLASPRVWGPVLGVVAVLALVFYAYLGAVVSPEENLEDLPIALVNEDRGGELAGKGVNLGDSVVEKITAPGSPAAGTVDWIQSGNSSEALKGIGNGEYYGAIVIPGDYTQRISGLAGPPAGVPPSGQPPASEPAGIELLTSPAVGPSTTAQIQNAFSGIVGGVSGATSERILGGLSEQGAPVPQGTAAVISDPVKGNVSEADVSGAAGPLPKAPEPAQIEVLTNPSAGQAVATPVQNISTGIVGAVSGATSERLSSAAAEQGAQLTPEVAAVIGDPVRADVTEAQPVGPDSGNGQSPFSLAFLVNLSGLIGGAAIFFLVGGAAERLEARSLRTSRTGLWTVRLLLGLAYALLIAGAELWVAFGLLGVEHEASTAQVYLFLALATTAAASVTMLLAVAFGPAGIGISAVLNVILGLVSSGGLAPLEALPPFYQAYADWLPLRYVIDGLRSLLFYDGSLDAARLEGGWRDSLWFLGGRSEAAHLEDAVWMVGAYLVSAATLGYLISLVRDLFARRERPKTGKVAKAAG